MANKNIPTIQTIRGNVGIGTTDPTTALDVNGSIRVSGRTAPSSGNGFEIFYYSPADTFYLEAYDYTNSLYKNIRYAGLSHQFINGNVGIGTTSPGAKLQIASTGANPYSATLDSSSNMKGIKNVLTSNTDDMVGIYFATGTTTNGTHWSGITGSRSDNASHWGTQLNFYTHNNDTSNLTHATQKMVIKGDGNVGIGTTNPGAKLVVSDGTHALSVNPHSAGIDLHSTGNLAPHYQTDFTLYTGAIGAGSARLKVDSNGNVGIGTTSPEQQLDISAATPTILLKATEQSIAGGDNLGSILFYNNDASTAGGARVNSSIKQVAQDGYGRTALVFGTDTTDAKASFGDPGTYTDSTIERMRITSTGNVGIGTTDPNDKLDVAGFIRTTGDDGGLLIGHGSGGYGIKIGRGRIGDGLAYLDFIGSEDPTGGTYDTRFIKNAGDNGDFDINHNGTGHFSVNAVGGGDILLLNGNVGIGTTDPGSKLEVTGDTANALLTLKSENGGDNDAFMRFYDATGGGSYSVGLDAGTEEFKIAFDWDGDSLTTGTLFKIDNSGNVTANNFILDSDERLKENIEEIENKTIDVNWKTFEMKSDKGQKRYGVVAQELEEKHPEFVRTDKEGMKSVAYTDLLIAKIAELEARLEELEK